MKRKILCLSLNLVLLLSFSGCKEQSGQSSSKGDQVKTSDSTPSAFQETETESDSFSNQSQIEETSLKVKEISLGSCFSAAISEDGSLYMWGDNRYGQLCNGKNGGDLAFEEGIDCNKPIKILDNITSVSMGTLCCSAITSNNELYMWGLNEFGQLGDGTTNDKYIPIKIMDHVKSVSSCSGNTAAITDDGSLYIWGWNWKGQLGNGTADDEHSPIKIMENVKSISLGDSFCGAITEDGSLYMWGSNTHGYLGDGTTNDKHMPIKIMDHVKSVSLGYSSSAAITEDGSLYMWGGINKMGQLGDGTTETRITPVKIMDHIKSVSLDADFSGAVTEDGSLYMWGSNFHGKLGNNNYQDDDYDYRYVEGIDSNTPIKIMDHVKSVSLGGGFSGAITEDGSLYMWGDNTHGELGDGTTEDRHSPTKITLPN